MADRWFYLHGVAGNDSTRSGPFSSRELFDLASSGQILPTDTVWKEGVVRGVLARLVKNLFRLASGLPADGVGVPPVPVPPLAQAGASEPLPTSLPPVAGPGETGPATATQAEAKPNTAAAPVAPAADPLPDEIGLLPEGVAPAPPVQPPAAPQRVRKGRAVGGKGAVIVGQDGTTVKFRKKCTTCGYEDATRNALKITNGVTRVGFYCPKCHKRREVEIQGILN